MSTDDDSFDIPLYRSRRSIEVMIDVLKKSVVSLHLEASRLSGRRAAELREIADDMDDHAEELKKRLKDRAATDHPNAPTD
jgi:rubrerythrin